ncbi:uncharacterized protein [Periplaneta americana]|uniref:uncharacterized protein n=1 Tax=Periplaneta americana TaxID=6978 RepID=UPI0037E7E860
MRPGTQFWILVITFLTTYLNDAEAIIFPPVLLFPPLLLLRNFFFLRMVPFLLSFLRFLPFIGIPLLLLRGLASLLGFIRPNPTSGVLSLVGGVINFFLGLIPGVGNVIGFFGRLIRDISYIAAPFFRRR